MKTTITATAPSVYQMKSLHYFRLDIKKHPYDSGATGTMEFPTRETAKEHLRECAQAYNDTDPDGTNKCLHRMFSNIKHGHLTLDAVTAYIQ